MKALKLKLRPRMNKRIVMAISGVLGFIFFIFYLMLTSFNLTNLIFAMVGAFMIVIIPYTIYTYRRVGRLRKMEERFPDFLRDILSGVKAGMTLPKAIIHCSNIDYGELTPEVKRMAIQLSWAIPFPKVIKDFEERVGESSFLKKGAVVLLQCFRSGGDVAAVLESTIENMMQIKKIEKEKQSVLSQQVITIFMVQAVFIVILIMVYKLFMPLLTSFYAFKGAQLPITVIDPAEAVDHFKTLFLITLLLSSVTNGIIIGKTKEGKAIMGTKYAIYLIIISLVAYTIFILPRTIEVKCELPETFFPKGGDIDLKCQFLMDASPMRGLLLNLTLTGKGFNYTKVVVTDEDGKIREIVKAPTIPGNYTLKVEGTYVSRTGEKIPVKEEVQIEVG